MKKRSKTFLSLLLIAMLALCFAACGGTGGGSKGNTGGAGNGSTGSTPSEGGAEQTSPEHPEQPEQSGEEASVVVVYFSCTNTTKGVAEKIAQAADGELFRIVPAQEYTAGDLNYNSDCRANREQNDPSARPVISNSVEDISKYTVVFIGYPIWWGKLPKIVYTFLDTYDLSGKTVVPFCTSGGSGISVSVGEIKAEEPDATVLNGKRFSGSDGLTDIREWVKELNLNNEKEIKKVNIYCGNNKLEIELADNPSAKAFAKKVNEGDVTVTMNDFGDFEKVGPLGFSLVQTNAQITTSPGDVILYRGNSITVYYGENSWNFTRLGKINGMTRDTMLAFFGGKGEVTVTFSLK